MRGSDDQNGSLFSYLNLEDRIPARHPLRTIREVVNAALAMLDADFAGLYAGEGRPSIAPERLLRASLIQILFSIRSERQLMEQMQYNLLFRWFVGLGIDDAVWVPTVFSKNRDRLLNTDIAAKFLAAILAHGKVAPLLSDDHFSVDGTLVEAWASFKSFRPKVPANGVPPADDPPPPDDDAAPPSAAPSNTDNTDNTEKKDAPMQPAGTEPRTKTERVGRNTERDWRGNALSNATHASVTDPEARLFRKGKGKPAQLCYMGHALMENRHGFIVGTALTHADGYAERAAALTMIERHSPGSERRLTLGADKGYDAADFVADLRRMCVTPHVAAKAKGSAIDGRTTRHSGYGVSQRKRKQVEEPFGWGKTVGQIAKTMLRGVETVGAQFTLNMAAFNLAKLPKLIDA
jgi:transposase